MRQITDFFTLFFVLSHSLSILMMLLILDILYSRYMSLILGILHSRYMSLFNVFKAFIPHRDQTSDYNTQNWMNKSITFSLRRDQNSKVHVTNPTNFDKEMLLNQA